MPSLSKNHGQPVIIAGGGIGGLGAALALASRGYRSIVLEAHQSYSHVDRGDILHAASTKLLDQWGALPFVVQREPLPFTRFRIIDDGGANLFDTDTQSLLGAQHSFLALKHQDITASMADAARDTGLVDIKLGERVIDLRSTDAGITGVQTTTTAYEGALTVLAMGKRSALRDKYFGASEVHSYGTSFFNACVKAITDYRDCGFYVLGKGGVMVLVPLPRGEMRIGIQYDSSLTDERPTNASFAEIARRRLRPLKRATIELLEPGRVYNLKGALSERWWISGCVLLGDTAHLVHPIGGQGMNLALADAEALASHVAEERPHDRDGFNRAAQRYAELRRPAVYKVARRTHRMGLTANWQSPALTTLRNTLIRMTHHVTPLKRALMERVTEVR